MNERETMKTLISVAAMLAAVGMVAGCFTSATAYTETTHADGSVTVSKVKVVGTGDKASEIAAEGLFADGTADDLGAGVKTASASQTSTGIDGTLAGLGTVLQGMAQFMAASQGAGIAGNGTQSASVVARPPLGVSGSSSVSVATGAILSGKVAEAKAAGKTLVVIAGSPDCSYCTSLDAALNGSALPSRSDIVLVRETAPWASNSALAWTGGGDAPVVRVTRWNADGTESCDTKLNRPNVAEIEAAIGACVAK